MYGAVATTLSRHQGGFVVVGSELDSSDAPLVESSCVNLLPVMQMHAVGGRSGREWSRDCEGEVWLVGKRLARAS